jgi:hypothetical protein
MRTFKDILTESTKTYKFLVRVAGPCAENTTDKLKMFLEKFKVVSVSNPKRSPIQETPMDFPQLENMEVTTWEVEIQYPTTRHVLQEYLYQHCDLPRTHLNVRAEGDPIEEYQTQSEDQPYESMLNTEDMGGESAQDSVGSERIMSLLKELETARNEREIDPVDSVKPGESKDIQDVENTKSTIGS